jgi:hypothetical protein
MATSPPSTMDAAERVREVGFALVLRKQRPIDLDELVKATRLDTGVVREAIATLAGAGRIDLVDDRIGGVAGLSLVTGPHHLTVGEAPFLTWCAYDALGIASALRASAMIETSCGHCGALIVLAFHAGPPKRSRPELLWLADAAEDLRRSFCTPTVLLCGQEHGSAWAEAQGGRGRLLDLAAASRAAGVEWASCAAAARRLA